MSSLVQVAIHPSQFPERVRSELLHSLRSRRINHKFHYDSVKQTHQWLALHQAYSPSRTDADCASMYDRAFAEAAAMVTAPRIELIGLGCGGGQKDTRLLQLLHARCGAVGNSLITAPGAVPHPSPQLSYTPVDVSTAMVLVARETALRAIPGLPCFPVVCDLALADDLAETLARPDSGQTLRLVSFFGMIPNFEPGQILPRLASVLRPGDLLLLSANLSPGPDYLAGIQRILPLYDNALTRNWLMTFLRDLGVENADGELRFLVEGEDENEDEEKGTDLRRVAAYFKFTQSRTIHVDSESLEFAREDQLRLFFSYRHTPAQVRSLAESVGFEVVGEWTADFAGGRRVPAPFEVNERQISAGARPNDLNLETAVENFTKANKDRAFKGKCSMAKDHPQGDPAANLSPAATRCHSLLPVFVRFVVQPIMLSEQPVKVWSWMR